MLHVLTMSAIFNQRYNEKIKWQDILKFCPKFIINIKNTKQKLITQRFDPVLAHTKGRISVNIVISATLWSQLLKSDLHKI